MCQTGNFVARPRYIARALKFSLATLVALQPRVAQYATLCRLALTYLLSISHREITCPSGIRQEHWSIGVQPCASIFWINVKKKQSKIIATGNNFIIGSFIFWTFQFFCKHLASLKTSSPFRGTSFVRFLVSGLCL